MSDYPTPVIGRVCACLRRCVLLCLLTAVVAGAAPSGASAYVKTGAPFRPDHVLVRFKQTQASAALGEPGQFPSAPSAQMEAARIPVRASVGASLVKRFAGDGRLELWRLATGTAIADCLAQLGSDRSVEYAEPDFVVSVAATPDDPAYSDGSLWGLQNTGQSGEDGAGIGGADIAAPGGWDVRRDATPVIVAVIDTGIRRSHEDLRDNMWENTAEIPDNGIDDDGNGYVDDRYGINAITYTGSGSSVGDPGDDYGHGTHVAGTIGGVGNNGKGVVGVAWSVRLMACKFLDSNGSGYTSDAVECIDYARINGATVMNNSWGGGEFSQALLEAIVRARDAGVVFVAAAGNSAVSNDAVETYPAGYRVDNVVAVAATTRTDGLAYFSNFGQSTVGLGAPGYGIFSTFCASDTAYTTMSGTSMATPHVSGAVALLKAQFPGEAPVRLINRLYNSARPIPALAGKTISGGVLNLAGALTSTDASPWHNQKSRALVIAGASGTANFSIAGNNEGATKEAGEPEHGGNAGGASVWYSFTAGKSGSARLSVSGANGFNPILAVYLPSAGGGLISVGAAATGTTNGEVELVVQAGRTYLIAVDGYAGTTGGFTVSGRQPPGNDDFAHSLTITGNLGASTLVCSGAGLESGEPDHGANSGGASVWYTWTAPASGSYSFMGIAQRASGRPSLSVYTGDSITALGRVSTVDIGGGSTSGSWGNWQSETGVRFDAVAGVTYRFQAYGFGGGNGLGLFRLAWAPTPANDDFANRATLAGIRGTVTGDTRGAVGSPSLSFVGWGTKDVWFAWTAPNSGWVEFDTLVGTDWDTTLEVYTGAVEAALKLLVFGDNQTGLPQSAVAFAAEAGTTYMIRLGGYIGTWDVGSIDTPAGPYQLSWFFDPTHADFDGDGQTDLYAENRVTGERRLGSMRGTAIAGWSPLGTIGAEWHIAGTADFDGDGRIDLVWENSATGERYLWLMDGTAYRTSVYLGCVPTEWRIAGVGDFNADGNADLVWENGNTGDRYLWLMDRTAFSAGIGLGTVATEWRIAGTGDFSGDGQTEILWENSATGERYLWLMNGTSYLRSKYIGTAAPEWHVAGTGDFNSDGQTDLLWENGTTGEHGIWLMNGAVFNGWVSLGTEATDWRIGN